MRRLDLTDYMVAIKAPDQMNPGQVIKGEMPYKVKESIINVMFNPELKLTAAGLVRQNMLAMKLEGCKDEWIDLEDAEYALVRAAIDIFTGFSRNDLEFVRRFVEMPTV